MVACPSASLLALLLVLGYFRGVEMSECTAKVEECLQAHGTQSTPGQEICGVYNASEKCFDRLVKDGTCWSITVGASSEVISLRTQHVSCSEKTISATHKVSSILLVVSLTVAVVFALRPRL